MTKTNLNNVVFLGGNPRRLASVQIRGMDIAGQLGCACIFNTRLARQVPEKFTVFVCVKPYLPQQELHLLAQRGKIIWDIIDAVPPREDIALYLASTKTAKAIFSEFGKVAHIPHHHCNFEGSPNPPGSRRPGWIGYRQWLPEFHGFEFDVYDVEGMTRADVVQAHRQMGLGLNFRAPTRWFRPGREEKLFAEFHVAVNSGIKLINCLGFGLPSISGNEPAYAEIASGCTLFSTPRKCAKWVRALQNDDDLYGELREKCIRNAKKFQIGAIAQKYRALLESL